VQVARKQLAIPVHKTRSAATSTANRALLIFLIQAIFNSRFPGAKLEGLSCPEPELHQLDRHVGQAC